VKGEWLEDGSFACNLDEALIPEWNDAEKGFANADGYWMTFKLRRKRSGVLVLFDGDDGGEWIEIGRLQNQRFTRRGVMHQAPEASPYNCRLFSGRLVNEGYMELPGYTFEVLSKSVFLAKITHDACHSADPFNVLCNPW